MRVGSLFSGIGGMDLGLERAGMTVAWQSEVDPYACRVLAERWPNVPNLGDITAIDWSEVEPVDVICGGFPCQDISNAGARAGISGPKSGLWKHMAHAIREVGPRYVIVENVAALLVRGFDVVLADLSDLGFDAEWSLLSACRMGAPHTRDRMFVLAHRDHERLQDNGPGGSVDDAALAGGRERPEYLHPVEVVGGRHGVTVGRDAHHWSVEPDVGRMADGVSDAVDIRRLFALGNAVVPQVAEYVGRRLMAAA